MAKKNYSADLEKRAIKAITTGGMRGQKLMSLLKPEHFKSATAAEAFNRIRTLLNKRGVVVDWASLTEDGTLADETRGSLKQLKEEVTLDDHKVATLFESLDRYRQTRSLIKLYNNMGDMLDSDDFDVEEASKELFEQFADIRSSRGGVKITTIGTGDNAADDVRKIISGEAIRHIPTGFRTYDDVNAGLILAQYMMIAATTGGGKSALLKTLARNMALQGAKVAFIPLEMKNLGVLARNLAEESGIVMNKFLDPKKRMTQQDRDDVWHGYKLLSKDMKETGGKMSFIEFEEDISIQDLLLYLRPLGYNVIIIDYVGLLEGADGDDQAKALSRITRYCVRWTALNDALVIGAAQLSQDGLVRYSRAMTEHAANLWQWIYTPANAETKTVHITQPKSRNQEPFDFHLHFDPATMTVRDLTKKEREELKGRPDDAGAAAGGGGRGNQRGGKGDAKGKKSARYFDDLNDD